MQLGIALRNYESTHESSPPAWSTTPGRSEPPKGYHFGWIAQILPYVEQRNIYGTIEFLHGVYDDANSRRSTDRDHPRSSARPTVGGPGAINYAACHHDVEAPIAADNHGVLFLNSHVGYEDIPDGAAYTILLGEKHASGATWAGPRAPAPRSATPGPRSTRRSRHPVDGNARDPGRRRAEMESLIADGLVPLSSSAASPAGIGRGELRVRRRLGPVPQARDRRRASSATWATGPTARSSATTQY